MHSVVIYTLKVLRPMKLTFVMVPTALVLPSLNTSLWSMCRYSGVLMKRKCTVALSPVRKQSLVIERIVAVCLMLPQCTVGRKRQVREMVRNKSHIFAFKSVQVHVISPIAWYLGEMVVGWCKTSISASNSQYACGFNRGDTMTMPFLIDERLIWRREKWCNEQQECFPQTYTLFVAAYICKLILCQQEAHLERERWRFPR